MQDNLGRVRRCKCGFQGVLRLVCKGWCTAAGHAITKATGHDSAGIATMHLHTPCLTTFTERGCSLQFSDFDKISRLCNLRHLTDVATGDPSRQEKLCELDSFDSRGHYLFAAPGFRSPLEGLTNLVSLHIEENIPNVTPQHCKCCLC